MQHPHSPISYRSEIDGLRALAVTAVILFHLSKEYFPSGYLGVDIFFVISGFLISRIIEKQLVEGAFSFGAFYRRRIKRILPALACVLIATTCVASLLLLPSDLAGYSRSLVSALFFFSNVYFWRDTNYFSPNAETKPLLHIWSLSLEEQFYIVFPAILVLSYRLFRTRAWIVVLLMTAGSLAAYLLLNRFGGGSPAFFLLPTRAWQLGAGALAGLLSARIVPGRAYANAISTACILLLFAVVFGLLPFKAVGLAVTSTVAAAIFLLLTSGTLGGMASALRWSPITWVGRLSYSLYLWHWPVIVLYKYYFVGPFLWPDMALCAALTLALSIASFHFIEERFRKEATSFRRVGAGLVSSAAILCLAAFATIANGGFPGRLPAEAAAINEAVGSMYRCPVSEYVAIGFIRGCNINMAAPDPDKAEVVLMGNSHALMYAPVWKNILTDHDMKGILANVNGCLPTTEVNISPECLVTAARSIDAVLALKNVRTIIIGMTWWHQGALLSRPDGQAVTNPKDAVLADALTQLIMRIQASGKNVILIGPIAQPGFDIASTLSRQKAFGWPNVPSSISRSSYEGDFSEVKSRFRSNKTITFVEPDVVQCHDQVCDFVIGNRSLFADESHIARAELYRFSQLFEAAFRDSQSRPMAAN